MNEVNILITKTVGEMDLTMDDQKDSQIGRSKLWYQSGGYDWAKACPSPDHLVSICLQKN